MELLYIWIEGYKNLKEQGFSFSSKHRFEFTPEKDEEGKIIGGKLHHEKNPNHIENFFGENITNVTAIIGENGAGKSNLLEAILLNQVHGHKTEKGFMVFELEDEFILHNPHNYKIEMNFEISDNKLSETSIHFIYYANYLNNFPIDGRNGISIITPKELLKKIYNPAPNHKKSFPPEHIFQIFELEQLKKQAHVIPKIYKDINLAFLPHLLIDFREPIEVPEQISNIGQKYTQEGVSFEEYVKYKAIVNIVANDLIEHPSSLEQYSEFNQSFSEKKDIHKINKLFSLIEKIHTPLYPPEIYKNKSNLQSQFDELGQLLKNIKKYDKSYNTLILNPKKDLDAIELILNFMINNPILVSFVSIKWVAGTNIGDFVELSTGERAKLDLCAHLYNVTCQGNFKLLDNIIICVDEGELGFHPQWQKEYLKNLIDFLPKIFTDKKIQIILTSHSPFLVSDLPKENIIFLEKDKDEKSKVSQLQDHENTFGQNIHTLLTDSFFMDKGLMGDFAKTKILELYENLHSKEKISKKEKELFEKQINIIGEPLLRNSLLKLLEEKISDKDAIKLKIQKLKDEIKRLEQNNENI